MELNEPTVTQISGIKRWSTIVPLEHQYVLQHDSNNGSQIAILNYDKSKNRHQTIPCKTIHDKFGKYLQMCQLNYNKNIIVFALDNGNIIKCNFNINNNNIRTIPSVPNLQSNQYDIIKISDCEESLLVSLKQTTNANTNNIWIYNENIQKWFNTQYNNEITDTFKSYKYYNNSWYIMDISSDTSMSYELNISIHKLSVIMDDQISEMSNEEISVYTDCIFTIDLSEIKQYLTNKIHKILWDLKYKLIVLLFDEFIIWISIKNDLKEPLYVLSLIPKQNIKFRDMIFMFNGILIAVVTNHGSIIFYQRLSENPIYMNYHKNNINENILQIDWKKFSKIHAKNSFKLFSRNDSNLLLHNGHTIVEYIIDNFKLKYFASNSLAFVRNVDWIQQQLNENKMNDKELLYICDIVTFDMKERLKKDVNNMCFMNSFLWFIECENIITKYDNICIWELIFIAVLENKQSLLKHENMLKIIKICNNYFDWISKCLDIQINEFYDEMECIMHTNGIDILKFNWRDVFNDNNIENNLCNKLYTNIILLMFEERSQIITNRKIDNLIHILWCVSKLNSMYTKCKKSMDKYNIISFNSINESTQTQKLKQWLELQFDEIINNFNNCDNNCKNKEEFAYIFWKKISEYQQNLISNNKTKNDNIIRNLVSIISSNINSSNSQSHELNRQIIKIPIVSIYCNGKRNEYYDSELEFETIEIIKENKEQICENSEHKTPNISPHKSKSASPIILNNMQQNKTEIIPNDIKSVASSCNGNENDLLNDNVSIKEVEIDTEMCEEQQNISKIDNGEIIIDVNNIMKINGKKEINLKDIAKYVPEKYIFDRLTNKLTKEELIQLFATKMELKQNNKCINECVNKPTKKWKLIEYDINDKILENKQLSSKIKKKIKKYLRKKNKLIEIQKQKQKNNIIKSENKIFNAECNTNQEHKQIETEQEIKNNNLTTTITNDISFIANDFINENNKYELSIDTFDCMHIAPYKTTHTQTQPSDIMNAKYIPSKHINKANSNWFIAPLLQQKTEIKSNEKHNKINETLKQNKVINTDCKSIQNECKQSEIKKLCQDSKFIPVPVIGARTAGLSYIDPSIKINKNNLTVKFPSIDLEEKLNEIEEHKQLERDGKNSLLQSQCSLMLHSMATTCINDIALNKNKLNITCGTNTNLNDFQQDIAVMDAQIANLSALCNNIQNNYYKMNSTLDNNDEIYQNQKAQTENVDNINKQMSTMEAWSLLQSIQENLNSIDDEINVINNNETRKQQLKNKKYKI